VVLIEIDSEILYQGHLRAWIAPTKQTRRANTVFIMSIFSIMTRKTETVDSMQMPANKCRMIGRVRLVIASLIMSYLI